ncbi:MAG: hypothetical protein IJ193_01055 [Bacilli bacterium]|nr:hypothetical protein [Bacilli bacterium]
MVSNAQKREMLEKLSTILREMQTCTNIPEISEKTGIPTSTIQRYLNRPDYFMELSDAGLLSRENVPKALEFTRDWLTTAKQNGLQKGGQTSQEKHGFSKGEGGHFKGSGR